MSTERQAAGEMADLEGWDSAVDIRKARRSWLGRCTSR
jgi:hypothetical protein